MNGVKSGSSNGSAGGPITVSITTGDVDDDVAELQPMIGENHAEPNHDTYGKDTGAKKTTERSGLPLDRGWAWMVVLGRYIALNIKT